MFSYRKLLLFLSILSVFNLQSSEVGAGQSTAGGAAVKVAFEGSEGSPAVEYRLSLQEAALSGTLKNLIEGSEEEVEVAPIDLTHISDRIGSIIVKLMECTTSNESSDNLTDLLVDQIKSFNVTHEDITNLLEAINYLDIPVLDKALISYIKKHITGEVLDEFLKQVLLDLPSELIEKIVCLAPSFDVIAIDNMRCYGNASTSLDGNTVVAIGRRDNPINIFDRNGRLIGLNEERKYHLAYVSSNGNTIVARGLNDDFIYIFDRNGKVIGSNEERKYHSIFVSPDGSTIVANGLNDGFIYIFDRNGRLIGLNEERKCHFASVSSNGNTIVARGLNDGFIYIFDRNGKVIGSNKERRYYPTSVSSDGNTIIANGLNDDFIYIFSRYKALSNLAENLGSQDQREEAKEKLEHIMRSCSDRAQSAV